jgi:uncharacterized protein YxjI
MSSKYLLSRKWALTDRFAITDLAGQTQFDVQGRFALRQRLSIRDAAGTEVAAISRSGLRTRYDITAGSVQATVRPRGVFSSGFVIDSTAGQLLARGTFTGRKYEVLRGTSVVASVSQQLALRERFAVEVADGEDAVLMLAAILVIEVIRDDRRRQSAAAATAPG